MEGGQVYTAKLNRTTNLKTQLHGKWLTVKSTRTAILLEGLSLSTFHFPAMLYLDEASIHTLPPLKNILTSHSS